MTTHARLVLSDAREAVDDLADDLHISLWRRRWTAVVVLLRTTMDVLEKVDAKEDPRLAEVVKEMWEHLKKKEPAPAIFWDFIREDRNLIAHQYKHRAGQSLHMHGVGIGTIPYAETTYEMNAGAFAGEDPRHVARQALDWLQGYLDEADRRAY